MEQADRDDWLEQGPDNTPQDGRFSVIAANTGETIDLEWLSDRVGDIPNVQWLVTRVAIAVGWPSDWTVLGASAGEYGNYWRTFGPVAEHSPAVLREDTSLSELSKSGQLLHLTLTLLDVEDDRWLCPLCQQWLNGPRALAAWSSIWSLGIIRQWLAELWTGSLARPLHKL